MSGSSSIRAVVPGLNLDLDKLVQAGGTMSSNLTREGVEYALRELRSRPTWPAEEEEFLTSLLRDEFGG